MGKTVFIKEIITMSKEPRLCPTCEKDDRLEINSTIREERSDGKTILCSRCEALIVSYRSQSKKCRDIIKKRRHHHAKRAPHNKKSRILVFFFLEQFINNMVSNIWNFPIT